MQTKSCGPVAPLEEEQLVDVFSEPFGKLEGEEGGGAVLAGFDRTNRLPRDPGQGGQLFLGQFPLRPRDLQPVSETVSWHTANLCPI